MYNGSTFVVNSVFTHIEALEFINPMRGLDLLPHPYQFALNGETVNHFVNKIFKKY